MVSRSPFATNNLILHPTAIRVYLLRGWLISIEIGCYFHVLQDGNGKHDPMLITIVNLTAVAIRRLIKIAKKINAFKNMCEEDQVWNNDINKHSQNNRIVDTTHNTNVS